jgi:TetR/AcrR family transcriptional regulator, transcriptional repressor for nem operon
MDSAEKRLMRLFFANLVFAMGKGAQTRQRIIEQAAPLFNQGGMAGCSMQDILDATGLQKGGLYRHFSSKEELAAECLKYSLALVFQARSGNADHIPNAIDKLRYLLDRFVSTPSPLKGGCPLMNAAVDSDDGDPQLRRLSLEGLRTWKSRLLQILEEGIKRGEVVSGTDPVRVVNTVIATLEGSLLISRIERTSSAMEDARLHLHAVLDGLKPTKAAEKLTPRRVRAKESA